ncbi:hypothetical protein [Falsibacillus pallidus]|uniref:Coupling factor for flagellin transcription and translation n=1 Tax=Falsibacillus pallidus TaxID=493781 RepID=A0A370GW00_9BACI|nr:hypothetical protein [Falsibacillus pallidus]RDI47430.1 hypothetical protein DFR59_10185 [Falsibacillus pallidus]
MITFIIIILFIMNIIALFSIVLLYMRQNRLVDMEQKQRKMIAEMEDVISSYLIEMKEENEKFISEIERRKSSGRKQHSDNPAADAAKSNPPHEHEESAVVQEFHYSRKKAAEAYAKNAEAKPQLPKTKKEKEPLHHEVSFAEKVISLKKQGMTVEEIAEKLNTGKTEIELSLKFRQKNQ